MDGAKRARLEAHGHQVGTVAEFLGLPPEEGEIMLDIKTAHYWAKRLQKTHLRLKTMMSSEMVEAEDGVVLTWSVYVEFDTTIDGVRVATYRNLHNPGQAEQFERDMMELRRIDEAGRSSDG